MSSDHLMTIFGENLNPDLPSVCQAAISVVGAIDSHMGIFILYITVKYYSYYF